MNSMFKLDELVSPTMSAMPVHIQVDAKRVHAKATDAANRRRRTDQVPSHLTGDQVRAWRKKLGITIDRARKLLGMSKSAYIDMERKGTDRKRTVLALRAIKHALHLLPLQGYEKTIVNQDITEKDHG